LRSSSFAKHLSDAGKSVWDRLPVRLRERRPVVVAGSWIHKLALRLSGRSQSESTWFLRNEPLLLTIRDVVSDNFKYSEAVRLCVVGCGSGAEIHSVLWTLRRARRDLRILPIGIDISSSAIAKAKTRTFTLEDAELAGGFLQSRREPILSEESMAELFDRDGESLRVKDWIASGVQWEIGDARDPAVLEKFVLQDVVIANNFLVHMKEQEATACLRNILQLVKPGGFFICRGVDLDIRERAARQFRLSPIQLRIEEIHGAAPDLDARRYWPWKYYGLEPLDKRRRNWVQRYASVFQVPKESQGSFRAMGKAAGAAGSKS
jgi:2-polyprenyl-3-methyl-5-hydroxy-6-metoxy-1,4-benzoquinol methylase